MSEQLDAERSVEQDPAEQASAEPAVALAEEPITAEAATEQSSTTEKPAAELVEAEEPAEAPNAAAEPEKTAQEPAQKEAEASSAAAEPEKTAQETAQKDAEVPNAAAEPEKTAQETAQKEAEAPSAAAEPEKTGAVAAGKIKDAAAKSTAEDAEPAKKVAPADTPAALAPIAEALENKKPIKGKVIGWNKGGYHVAIDTIAAFCPVSQIEIDKPRNPKRYLDRNFDFMVIEIEKGGRRVVVSRADALKKAKEQRLALVREHVKPGEDFDGKVSSLTDFGAFVKLGHGIEGLIHVSEISRRRVEHPRELLEVGQKVKVRVLKIEQGGERISLSMKKLEADPWKTIAERFPPGDAFEGTIRRKTDFGLFVEVEPGIEGLVHTSRLPLGKGLEDEGLEIGQKVEGWVHDAEPKRRRLALSLRPVGSGQPWKDVESRFPIGSVVTGQVERVADFGAFIQLEPGLTGLLPFSELKQTGVNLKRQYHAGKEVSVRIMSIDTGRKRISLGTESSKAVGTTADFRDYRSRQPKGGMGAMAAAFAKLQEEREQQ